MSYKIRAVFLDLDNTLYDWTRFFAPALRGMCATLSELTDIPSQKLYSDFRDVFRRHGSVEYSWALQELDSLKLKHPDARGQEIVNMYRPVIDTFQHRRRKLLKLYPGVATGLQAMRAAGIQCIAVTDAHRWQSSLRIRQLGLEDLLTGLASRSDHSDPSPEEIAGIRRYPEEHYKARIAYFDLPDSLRKPDPSLLISLIDQLHLSSDDCFYVGDNLAKDIAMAQNADVLDCWAAYGTRYNPLDIATLARVTPWSAAAVEAVLDPTPTHIGVYPTLTASCFSDVVRYSTSTCTNRSRRRHAWIQI